MEGSDLQVIPFLPFSGGTEASDEEVAIILSASGAAGRWRWSDHSTTRVVAHCALSHTNSYEQ
jgi:hypothetical protein